jgi:hypothetical protein
MGDVADVHHLPSGAEQNARGTAGLRRERSDEGGSERRVEKSAAIHKMTARQNKERAEKITLASPADPAGLAVKTISGRIGQNSKVFVR